MFAEDLQQFVRDFGIEAVFSRSSIEILTARGILDAPTQEVAVYDRSFYDEKFYSAKVLGAEILFYGLASELAVLQPNDAALVEGVNYFVVSAQADGTGMMFVFLSLNRI